MFHWSDSVIPASWGLAKHGLGICWGEHASLAVLRPWPVHDTQCIRCSGHALSEMVFLILFGVSVIWKYTFVQLCGGPLCTMLGEPRAPPHSSEGPQIYVEPRAAYM